MSKIHITLVGGQPIPVYLGIMEDTECEEVILIHSYSSLKEAEIIASSCEKKCSFVKCSPTDIKEVKKVADKIHNKIIGHEVTLNITSGTKPWSLIFYQTFSDIPSFKAIYINQLNHWYDLNSDNTKQLYLDVFKRFELYGTPLKKYQTLDAYTKGDCDAISQIEATRRINVGAFTELTNKTEEEYQENEGEVFSRNDSCMKWNWNEKWVEFTIIDNDIPFEPVKIELDHPKELVLYAAWFELKTALELRKNPNIKEIYINCEFLSKEEKAKNEIDIIADFGTRLLFVECKTMIYDITAIDKFRSAMRNFSGTSSTGVFVTNDCVFKGTRYERFMAAMEKCKDNDIVTFNFGFWEKVGKKKMNSSLNSIIDRAISQINKR